MISDVTPSRRAVQASARSARRRARTRSLMLTTLTLAAATALGVSAAGGTYAWLNASAPVSGATVTSARAGLTVNDAASATLTAFSLAPGVVRTTALKVSNTSTPSGTSKPLALTPVATVTTTTTNAINGSVQMALTPVANAAACTASTGILQPMSSYPATTLPSIAPAASQYVCLRVTLPAGTPATVSGQSVGFTIAFSADQGS